MKVENWIRLNGKASSYCFNSHDAVRVERHIDLDDNSIEYEIVVVTEHDRYCIGKSLSYDDATKKATMAEKYIKENDDND